MRQRRHARITVEKSDHATRVARDTGERVEIAGRNRIKLVIVTTRARNRKTKQRASRDINRARDAIGFILTNINRRVRCGTKKPPARAQRRSILKTERRARTQQISRDMLRHETRGRNIAVERVDDIIAVTPRVWNRVVKLMRERLGVTHEVEPMSSPTLAIRGIGEVAIDERRELRVTRISGKRAHIGFIRRKSAQIERESTEQCRRIGIQRWRGECVALTRC